MADTTASERIATAATYATSAQPTGHPTGPPEAAWLAASVTATADLVHRAHRYGVHEVGLPATLWGATATAALRHAEQLLRRNQRALVRPTLARRVLPATLAIVAVPTVLVLTAHSSAVTRLMLVAAVLGATQLVAHLHDRLRFRARRMDAYPGVPAEATIDGLKTAMDRITADIEAAHCLLTHVVDALHDAAIATVSSTDGLNLWDSVADPPVRLLPDLRLVQLLLTYARTELIDKREEL